MECAGSKRESSKVMEKATEIAFVKRLFSQKREAVRLNILLAMYLCRVAVVKIWSQRVLHLLDRSLPSSQLGQKAAECFVSLDTDALGKDWRRWSRFTLYQACTLLIQSLFPQGCTSSRHNLQRFQPGRLLITTLTSRKRKKKRGAPTDWEKCKGVGIKRAEVLTRGAAKMLEIRPPRYRRSPLGGEWATNDIKGCEDLLEIIRCIFL